MRNSVSPAAFVPPWTTSNPLPVAIPGAVNVIQQPQSMTPRGYNANSPNQLQFSPNIILYDWQTIAAASTSFTFFSRSFGNGGLTLEDTNMQQPNNVGNGIQFIVQAIYIGLKLTTAMTSTDTDANIVLKNQARDYQYIMSQGSMQFNVNQVPQLGPGLSPLLYLAWPTQIALGGGIATGNAVGDQALAPIAINCGLDLSEAPFLLHDQLNFNGQVNFANAVTLPSGSTTSKIGMILKGRYYRPAG